MGACTEAAESLEPSCGTYRSGFRIGGVSVGIVGSRIDDVSLIPSLEPFRAEAGVSDINMQVRRAPELCPPRGRQLFDSGCTWRLYECGAGFQFDFHVAAFGRQPYKRLLIDDRFRLATLQFNEQSFTGATRSLSPWEYPLDELLIMHRLTQEKAIELHGCGMVGPGGTNNLFVGHSGAGKSTTTQLWTSCVDVDVLSDDRIIVRKHGGRIFMYGTPWHGEAAFASPASAPLTRIFVLEHGRGNVLTRLSRSQAVAELFARSFVPFHRHEYVDSALTFLETVAETIPCYRYCFEPDAGAVDAILNFHD